MKKLQFQKTKQYVLGMALSLLAACSSQPETAGTATDPTTDSSSEPIKDGYPGPNKELPMATSYSDNFIGEWQAVESKKRKHLKISPNGENFIIEEGDKTMPGIYDKDKKVIQLNIGVPMDIMYIEKEDMIVAARGGKYRRVSEK